MLYLIIYCLNIEQIYINHKEKESLKMMEQERANLEKTLLDEFGEYDASPAIATVLNYAPSNSSDPTDDSAWTAGLNRFFDDNPNLITEWGTIGNV
jgi:cell shape-determining protein MreC